MDISCTIYIGIIIAWNYKGRFVNILMPGYMSKALKLFLHIAPTRKQHVPHKWTESAYGQQI